MSSMSSDITYLVMEKFFPDTNMPEMRPVILYGVLNEFVSLFCEIKYSGGLPVVPIE